MLSLSNTLSLLRAPLALAFLIESAPIRLTAIFLAMCTDWLDGYLARRRRTTSQLGAVLDPLMDKFFVFFALSVLYKESKIELWQAAAMLSRDFFLCVFASYLSIFKLWENYRYKSIRWGKVSTVMQFLILTSLTLGIAVPNFVFALFILTGTLAFIQLVKFRAS